MIIKHIAIKGGKHFQLFNIETICNQKLNYSKKLVNVRIFSILIPNNVAVKVTKKLKQSKLKKNNKTIFKNKFGGTKLRRYKLKIVKNRIDFIKRFDEKTLKYYFRSLNNVRDNSINFTKVSKANILSEPVFERGIEKNWFLMQSANWVIRKKLLNERNSSFKNIFQPDSAFTLSYAGYQPFLAKNNNIFNNPDQKSPRFFMKRYNKRLKWQYFNFNNDKNFFIKNQKKIAKKRQRIWRNRNRKINNFENKTIKVKRTIKMKKKNCRLMALDTRRLIFNNKKNIKNIIRYYLTWFRYAIRKPKRGRLTIFVKKNAIWVKRWHKIRINYKNKRYKFFVYELRRAKRQIIRKNKIAKTRQHIGANKKIFKRLVALPVKNNQIKKYLSNSYYTRWGVFKYKISTVSWIILIIFEILLMPLTIRLGLTPSLLLTKKIFKYRLFYVNETVKKEYYIVLPFELVSISYFFFKIILCLSSINLVNFQIIAKFVSQAISLNAHNKLWMHDAFLKSNKSGSALSLDTPSVVNYLQPFKSIMQTYLHFSPNIVRKKVNDIHSNIFFTIKTNIFFYIPFIKKQLQ